MADHVFADAHCHSNPVSGLGAEKIAEKFKSVGGWFIALVSLPPYHYGFNEASIDAYRKTLELLVREVNVLRRNGLKAVLLAGFHPAEVDEYFKRGMELREVVGLAEKVFDLIVGYHKQGLIDGIGEVGRQHYSTAPPRLVASELILLKAMVIARDYDMFMHLHLEQGGWVTVESINKLSKMLGLRKDRIFLHHVSINEYRWGEKEGFWYTLPAKYKTLKNSLKDKPDKALVESDFIDDPRRPGVSSYPWDIAERITTLLKEGVIDEEYLAKIMVDNIVKAYHVEPP